MWSRRRRSSSPAPERVKALAERQEPTEWSMAEWASGGPTGKRRAKYTIIQTHPITKIEIRDRFVRTRVGSNRAGLPAAGFSQDSVTHHVTIRAGCLQRCAQFCRVDLGVCADSDPRGAHVA